jgi:hypothetical protein
MMMSLIMEVQGFLGVGRLGNSTLKVVLRAMLVDIGI